MVVTQLWKSKNIYHKIYSREITIKRNWKEFPGHLHLWTNKPENIETPVVEIGIRLNSGFTMRMKANVVSNITGKIQRVPVNVEIKEKLRKYKLADIILTAIESTYVDFLVGNDYYTDIVSLQRVNITQGLYLLQSKL